MLPSLPHIEEDCGPTEPAPPPLILPAHWKRMDSFYYVHRSGLAVILSEALERDGHRWRHLSVSARGRLPTWDELVAVKEVFLGTDTVAVQVLPPRREWVNDHPNVLHLFVRIGEIVEQSMPLRYFVRAGQPGKRGDYRHRKASGI